jgi:hypothetical protein
MFPNYFEIDVGIHCKRSATHKTILNNNYTNEKDHLSPRKHIYTHVFQGLEYKLVFVQQEPFYYYNFFFFTLISSRGSLLLCLSSLSESILESSSKSLHITHTSSSNSTLSLGLFCPVVRSHLLVGVSTGRTGLLLNVEGSLSATTTRGV